jgi:DNA-binding XRE family transcriptional regulator
VTISLGRGDIVLRPYFSYPEYMSLTKQNAPTIPNAVVNKVINKDMTPIRAWREHLGLTQTEVARRLGISQSAYAQQEAKEPVIAKALGIAPEQLVV